MAVRVEVDYISEESTTPEFCDVMDAEPQLLKIVRSDSDLVSSSAVNTLNIPFKGISWPSSSWIDGTRRSAFQPYRPSLCTTVLTNLQRGNTETQTLKQDFSQFTWHQKAGRGDVTSHDIPPDNTVDKIDSQGLTALMWASAYGQYSSVQLLIKSGASVNAVGCKNETPLLLATSEGHLDVVRILISNGANVNHTDKKGNTALIYASFNNHHHCVHELLLNGADLMMKNNAGDSAYGLAVKKNNRLVLAVIENYLLSVMDEGEYMAKSS